MDVTSVGPSTDSAVARDPIPAQEASQRRQIVKAIGTINEHQALGQHGVLTFVMDPSTRKLIIRVVNPDTKEVLMQVPPEYVLRLADYLQTTASHADKVF